MRQVLVRVLKRPSSAAGGKHALEDRSVRVGWRWACSRPLGLRSSEVGVARQWTRPAFARQQ